MGEAKKEAIGLSAWMIDKINNRRGDLLKMQVYIKTYIGKHLKDEAFFDDFYSWEFDEFISLCWEKLVKCEISAVQVGNSNWCKRQKKVDMK